MAPKPGIHGKDGSGCDTSSSHLGANLPCQLEGGRWKETGDENPDAMYRVDTKRTFSQTERNPISGLVTLSHHAPSAHKM